MAKASKKYLVIRLSSIGDIILTTPVLRVLNQQNVEIHFLMKESFSFVAEHITPVDHFWFYKKEDNTHLIKMLKAEKFDQIIDLHFNLRTIRLRKQLGIKSIGFDKLNVKKWFYVNTKWDLLPDLSIVDRYFDSLNKIGFKNDEQGLSFKLKDDPRFIQQLKDFSKRPIVISLGASFFTKRIPVNKIIELLNVIDQDTILIGGKDVVNDAEEITRDVKNSKLLDFSGKTSLNQSAIAIQYASVLITSDSAMMHIGAALKKKMIVLWGNTVPKFGMGPYYGHEQVDCIHINEMPSCKPCSKLGHDACPKGHFKCMIDVTVNRLKEGLDRLICNQ